MPELVVPVKRTAVTMVDYVRSCVRNWFRVGADIPLEQSIAVLWAQYMIETGGSACWNYNIGNVKHVKGDGHNYHMLNGVWEGVSPSAAHQLVASGQAVVDKNLNHVKAVGPTRVSVVFTPPHPATWFRAFPSLDAAMAEHLTFLCKRFSKAWPAVLAGDFVGFANLLRVQGYFTASADAYAAGMRNPYNTLIASTTYEELVASMNEAQEAAEEEVAEKDAVLWDRDTELENLVALMHQGASRLILEDMEEERRRRLIDGE